MAKIYLVDDHEALAEALAEKIDIHFKNQGREVTVSVFCTLAELEIGLKEQLPELLLLDLSLRETKGRTTIEAMQTIQGRLPSRLTIALFSAVDFLSLQGLQLLKDALANQHLRIKGVISKDSASDKLLIGINRLLENEVWIPDQILSAVLSHKSITQTIRDGREMDIARKVASGMSNREIATAERVGENYVAEVVGNLLRALEVDNRTRFAVKFNQSQF